MRPLTSAVGKIVIPNPWSPGGSIFGSRHAKEPAKSSTQQKRYIVIHAEPSKVAQSRHVLLSLSQGQLQRKSVDSVAVRIAANVKVVMMKDLRPDG